MNTFEKMPAHMESVCNFLHKHNIAFLNDYYNVLECRRKNKLKEDGEYFFQKKWSTFLTSYKNNYDIPELIFDNKSLEFGMSIISVLWDSGFVIYNPIQDLYYWEHNGTMYLNNNIIHRVIRDRKIIVENNDHLIPEGLLFAWFKTYLVDKVKITETRFHKYAYAVEDGFLCHLPVTH